MNIQLSSQKGIRLVRLKCIGLEFGYIRKGRLSSLSAPCDAQAGGGVDVQGAGAQPLAPAGSAEKAACVHALRNLCTAIARDDIYG